MHMMLFFYSDPCLACLGCLSCFQNYCIGEGSIINCRKSKDPLRLSSYFEVRSHFYLKVLFSRVASSFLSFYILIPMFHNGASNLESKHILGLSLGLLFLLVLTYNTFSRQWIGGLKLSDSWPLLGLIECALCYFLVLGFLLHFHLIFNNKPFLNIRRISFGQVKCFSILCFAGQFPRCNLFRQTISLQICYN